MLRVLSASLRSVGEMQLRNSRQAAVGCPFKAKFGIPPGRFLARSGRSKPAALRSKRLRNRETPLIESRSLDGRTFQPVTNYNEMFLL
jgi:hypothetical protein